MILFDKKRKSQKLKGSVLFTVLVVMIVILLMLITTIGLAQAASRRAYYEYNERQTMATARSVVNSIISTFGKDQANEAVGQAVISAINSTNKAEVVVNSGGNLGDGFGQVESLLFEKVGTDTTTAPGSGNYYFTGSGDAIIKVTATVVQGGVTSTFSQYVLGASQNNHATQSGGGLVALGGFEGACQPGVDANAPAYFGINSDTALPELVLGNANKGHLGNMIINAPLKIETEIPVTIGSLNNDGNGIMINGDLTLNNKLKVSTYGDGKVDIIDNPYIYVSGKIISGGAGELVHDQTTAPINIFCQSAEFGKGLSGNVNLFCYSSTGTSRIKYESTALLSWFEHQNEGKEVKDSAFQRSGNIYTNGSFEIGQNIKGFKLQGDMYVGKNLIIDLLNDADVDKITLGDNSKIFVENKSDITGSKAEKFKEKFAGKIFENTSDEYKNNKLLNQFKGSTADDKLDWNSLDLFVETPADAKSKFYEEGKFTKEKPESLLEITGNTRVYYWKDSGGKKLYYVKLSDVEDLVIHSEHWTELKLKPGVTENPAPVEKLYGIDFGVIDSSCIIWGAMYNCLIKPSAAVGEDGMWINTYGVNIQGKFVVDDSDNPGCKVNFYVPSSAEEAKPDDSVSSIHSKFMNFSGTKYGSDTYVNSFRLSSDGTCILTKQYYDRFYEGKEINLVTYPDADNDDKGNDVEKNDWQVPNVGIYSSATLNGGKSSVLLLFNNNLMVSADICVPNADLRAKCGPLEPSKLCGVPGGASTIKYNSKEIGSGNVGVFGSIIVNQCKEYNNDFGMCYVDYSKGGDAGLDEDGIYRWEVIESFANY